MATVGFVGVGLMGEPMAGRLLAAGHDVVAWSRSTGRLDALANAGARVAATPQAVVSECDVVVEMLATEAAIREVFDWPADGVLGLDLTGCTVVHMSTTAPAFSAAYGLAVAAAGGRYVEAPVSGSRVPASRGELVAMAAGDPEDLARVAPLLAPMCRQVVECGAVPAGTLMKVAVNSFLITLVTGLAEAFDLARAVGLDEATFGGILDAGQMASPISTVKVAKLLAGDLSPQAAIADVYKNSQLVVEVARAAGAASPLLDASDALFAEALALGHGGDDMVGVIQAVAARRAAAQTE